MQLVAYGAQDIYLTGNPQITFFKVVYRRYTNFSMELIEQTFNGTSGPNARVSVTISRNGDLVHDVYYKIGKAANKVFSASAVKGNNPGYNMIDNVQLEIGGQTIETNYGHWLETNSELFENPSIATPGPYTGTSASATKFQNMAAAGGVLKAPAGAVTTDAVWVPLRFWFCRNPGLSIPLIALQYHEVKVITQFSAAAVFVASDYPISMWANYVYLDTDERRRFAQVSHEYLIEQVQYQSFPADSQAMTLNFNHPVKELIWTCSGSNTGNTTWGNNGDNGGKLYPVGSESNTWLLKLNGHDRFAAQSTSYFTRQQVWRYHTGRSADAQDNIAVYSFALKPEEHQPSGTCNFSRIDNVEFIISNSNVMGNGSISNGGNINVYAINYNVLRIMSGMGGLAYSN